MTYGQGKDPNARLREVRGYGSGWENVGQFIGGAITAGFGAKNGDMDKAMQGVNQMGSSLQGFSNKVAQNKQMSSGSLNLSIPQTNSTMQQGNTQQSTVQQPTASDLASTSLDMGAGYNPQSETFRSGSGQTITDRNKTFEQQATNALFKDNTLMASKGRKINYLSFFN